MRSLNVSFKADVNAAVSANACYVCGSFLGADLAVIVSMLMCPGTRAHENRNVEVILNGCVSVGVNTDGGTCLNVGVGVADDICTKSGAATEMSRAANMGTGGSHNGNVVGSVRMNLSTLESSGVCVGRNGGTSDDFSVNNILVIRGLLKVGLPVDMIAVVTACVKARVGGEYDKIVPADVSSNISAGTSVSLSIRANSTTGKRSHA